MARNAIMRELSGNMVGIHHRCKILLVATVAIGCESFILPARMARCTCYRSMRSKERECGRAVIEACRFPRRVRVTCETVMGEERCYVVRRSSTVEITLMTAEAIRCRSLELPVRVARCA